jgi:Amt family ammonium transporter
LAASVSVTDARENREPVKKPVKTGENPKFTKLSIITRQNMFEPLEAALNSIGVNGLTVSNLLGYGAQKGHTKFYRGVEIQARLLPKIRLEVVVSKVPVATVVDAVKKVLYTGNIGDGKIFIYDVENVIRIRTGAEGYDALQDEE